jgi:site-specific DNA-methyltransferase (adenine-specific)
MEDTPKQKAFTFLRGDALHLLKTLKDESVHAVITDPPYGLTADLDVEELLRAWLARETFVSDQNGYGGAEWDNSVPGPELWVEAYRLLPPGGHVLAFAAARTVGLTTIALQLAGFQVRDLIHWVYAPGRPSRNQAKVATELGDPNLALREAGLRPTLRPGHEPIVVARKPFEEPDVTVLENYLDYGVGAVSHAAITTAPATMASNVWVVHDLACTPGLCQCDVGTSGGSDHGTHIYPGEQLTDRSLSIPKPRRAERPVAEDGTRHGTVKPLALMRALIGAYSQPGQVILDPFLGSGTTAEAALLSGRLAVGCELNEEFFELIEQRIERVTAEQ